MSKEAHMAAARRWRSLDPSGSGHHDAAIHALHASDPEMDRQAVTGCGICDDDLETFRETASHLAQAVAADPPAHLKAAVFTKITQNRRLWSRLFRTRPIQPTNGSESSMSPPHTEQ